MKRVLHIILTILFFASFANGAWAQSVCESLTVIEKNSGVSRTESCAPVMTTLSADYTFSAPVDPDKIEFLFVMDHNNDEEFVAGIPDPTNPKKFSASVNYEYTNGQECNFNPKIYIVYDGVVCTGTEKEEIFHVWNTDDQNPDPFELDPVEAFFCPENPIVGHRFIDNTEFNCNPDATDVNPNTQTRWVQFVYNTGAADGDLIRDVTVAGVAVTDGNGDAIQQIHGPVQAIPVPAIGPEHETDAINAPANSPVGSYFEVTLRNWNVCNPYDDPNIAGPPADLVNGDNPPIETTARMIIVEAPQPVITAPADVCPDTEFQLSGTVSGLTHLEYSWEVFDDEEGNVPLTLPAGSNSNSFEFPGFSSPGNKLVRLKARRTDTEDQGCWGEDEFIIRVSAVPQIEARMNGALTDALDFCFDSDNPLQQVVYSHKLNSDNNYTYTYKLFKRNSTSDEPDSTSLTSVSMPAEQEANDSYTADYTQPGQYKIWMVAVDNVTDCKTEKESVTNIYDTPVPNFTSTVLCVGQTTSFTNTSSLPTVVNDDQITDYLWDFGDGTGTSTDENPDYTYASAGTYTVTLKVTTQGGCTEEVENDVTVKEVPQALLDYDYSGPICPGKVPFQNLSFTDNNADFGDGVVIYTLVRTDGTTEEEFAFEGEEKEFLFTNTTSANVSYQVWLKAEADGCEKLSDPLTVEVVPGAQAGFSEPNYKTADINCSVFDFSFVVDQATLDLNAEEHHWKIYKNEVFLVEFTFEPGDDGFEVLEYTAENNDEVSARYEVFLIATKPGLCIQTAENAYKVYPQPPAEDIQVELRNECEFSFVKVKVNGSGVRNYFWNIDQTPENDTEIVYDEEFEMIFQRPEGGAGNLPVNISLIKENYFGCSSEEMEPAGGAVIIPEKVMDEVSLELLNPGDEKGCSPLEVDFVNTTNSPAGTSFEVYIKRGLTDMEPVSVEGDIHHNFSYTFTESGVYVVSMQAIAPDGCALFSETNLVVEVYSDPRPYFDIEDREGCSPFAITLRKNIGNSISNRWFVTDLDDNSTKAEEDISIYALENNTSTVKSYEIKLESESPGGCLADSSIIVQVFPATLADFEIENADQLCQPYDISVTNTSEAPEGTTFTWNWGDGTSESSHELELTHSYVNPSYSNTLYRNISLTLLSPDGCESTVMKELSILPQVKVAVVPNKTIGCAPLEIMFRNNSEGITSHLWEVREQDSEGAPLYESSASLPEIPALLNEGNSTKVYEVLYTGSNAAGCTGSSLTEISVLPGAQALFSMNYDDALCAETEVTFTNEDVKPGIDYIWQWNDGEPNDTTTTATSITHTFTNASTTRIKQFEVTLTAKIPGGDCAHHSSKFVEVNPDVLVQVSPDKEEGCAPLEVNFRNQSQNVASHYWYARLADSKQREQEQTEPEGAFLFSNSTNDVLNYEVVYVGTSPNGCADSAVHSIKVHPELQAQFSTDSVKVRLPNSTFLIFNETPHADAWSHTWDFGDGTTSTETDPDSHTYDSYGTYTITLSVSNGYCTDTYEQEVIVREILPIVDFKSIPVSGCWPLEVYFENQSKYADENTYYWDFGDGEGFSRAINPTYTYFKPGEYTVTLSASNPSGEVISTSYAIVTVHERPRISFEVRDNIVNVPGDPVYVANHTRGAVKYTWDFGDGTIYNEFEPSHFYQEPGKYTIKLIAENEFGCADTLVRHELVTAEPGGQARIPNAFTPSTGGGNGGNVDAGNNDVFFPILEGGIVKYDMKIYNRWGELLFETKDQQTGWDGYYKGSLCKSDVYVYKLWVEFSDGKTLNKLGDVTLIR